MKGNIAFLKPWFGVMGGDHYFRNAHLRTAFSGLDWIGIA